MYESVHTVTRGQQHFLEATHDAEVKVLADRKAEAMDELKDVEEEKASKGPNTVNNSLFVGSTAELAKMLKSVNLEDNK